MASPGTAYRKLSGFLAYPYRVMMPTLGPDWMDPAWLLDKFGSQFFWVSTAIIFIECGLLFPFCPVTRCSSRWACSSRMAR